MRNSAPGPISSTSHGNILPTHGSMMDVQPSHIVVLSALKISERKGPTLKPGEEILKGTTDIDNGRSIIIRVYNPYSTTTTAKIWVGFEVIASYLVNMKWGEWHARGPLFDGK